MPVANSQFFQNALKVFAPKVPGAVIYSDDLNEATDEIEALEAVLGVGTRARTIATFDPTATSWATLTARLNNLDAGVRSTDGAIHPQYALKAATVLQPADSTATALTVRGGSGGLADVLHVYAPDNTSLLSVTPLAVTTGRDTTVNGNLIVNGGNTAQLIVNAPTAYVGDVIRVVKNGAVVFSVKADGSLTSASSTTTTGSVSISDFTNSQHDHSSIPKGGRVIPAGVLMPFAGLTGSLPSGWLPCDGRAVSRVTYSDLFNAIGTSYGGGDGVNTFLVPDMRSRLPLGAGSPLSGYSTSGTLGGTGGVSQITLTSSQLPTHTHDITHNHTGTTASEGAHAHAIPGAFMGNITTASPFTYVGSGQASAGRGTLDTGAGSPHVHTFTTNQFVGQSQNNTPNGGAVGVMNPYLVVNYIIKT